MNSKINPVLTLDYMCYEKEGQFFDRKSAKKTVKELANYVAGFANASGGTLAIGISDDGVIEGFEDCEEKYDKFLKITSGDYLKTVPKYENETIDVINFRGHSDKILLIHVSPSIYTLIRNVKDEVYLRQGDSTNRLSAEQAKILELDRHEISYEEQVNIRSSIEDIDMDMVQIYQKAIGAEEQDLLNILRARRFLVKDNLTNKECLTNAGTLLFAKAPSVFFPSVRVRIIKVEGKELQPGTSMNIVKDKTFTLPLYKQIKESQKFIETQLREFTHLDKTGEFITVPEYPKFAWEEGITNAVTHRNYAISGEHTKVFIFDDRMEIMSPGDLPGIVTVQNIKEKRYARNPIISRTLTELGLVRELNEGVSRIYKEMDEFFLEEPVYIEDKGVSLRLILKNNIIMRSKRKSESLLKDTNINLKWEQLNAMERKVLQIIFDKGEVTPLQISEMVFRDKRTVQRVLKKLLDTDLVEWFGTSIKDPNKVYKIKSK